MTHKEPKRNKRQFAPKPAGYGTTKSDLYDSHHGKRWPIQKGVQLNGVTGNMNEAGTSFYSDKKSLEWWKETLNPEGEWKLYEMRMDVTGACELSTEEIINNEEVPWSYKSMLALLACTPTKNKKLWIPDKTGPALVSNRGWVVVISPIICDDFDRLDAVKEDLRFENRSAVHVRRRTLVLEEANDFGGWFE